MHNDWTYDEFRQTGLDFGNEDEVRQYDEKFRAVRNFSAEAEFIARAIQLHADAVILELGTGTAELAVRLAPRCRKVTATDVSERMLSYAAKKAEERNVDNIDFVRAGFLSFDFPDETFDAVISQLALHHLPDFWKAVALLRIFRALKPGGTLYLLDNMMSFDIAEYEPRLNKVITAARDAFGEKIAREIGTALRDEYPTLTWILEGMLEKTGFRIEKTITYTDIMSVLICRKT